MDKFTLGEFHSQVGTPPQIEVAKVHWTFRYQLYRLKKKQKEKLSVDLQVNGITYK